MSALHTPVERIEMRYLNAIKAEDARYAAAQALLEAEYHQRTDAIFYERQRDFQTAGLDEGGLGPA